MNHSRKLLPPVVSALVLTGAGIFETASAGGGGRPLTVALAAADEVNDAGVRVPGDVGAAVEGALVNKIRKNPAGFGVIVHNKIAPAGAVRGQLGR